MKLALGIIIAQVPESLTTTVSVSICHALKKLNKKNCLVKNLQTIEKLGSVTTICSDKTGTITQNSMQIQYIWFNDHLRKIDCSQIYEEISLRKIAELHPLLYAALVCNSVSFVENYLESPIKKDW
jgi:sodium/potassium-transporting ATPase subunit alpha